MRNLDLQNEEQEEQASRSQDDSTDIEGEETSRQRGKTGGVSRKSNLNALTGNPSKLGKKQQLSILLSLIHDIRLVYNAALKVPRKHINVSEGGDDPELPITHTQGPMSWGPQDVAPNDRAGPPGATYSSRQGPAVEHSR